MYINSFNLILNKYMQKIYFIVTIATTAENTNNLLCMKVKEKKNI